VDFLINVDDHQHYSKKDFGIACLHIVVFNLVGS